jgi:SH3-like domain-containing protein
VPRYVSLKYAEVNARNGPDEAHQLLWIYHAKGLPVQVVAETREWRRICDPEGGLAWVHKRTTDGRRSAMRVQPTPLPLRSAAQTGAKVSAYLKGRSVANLDKCEKGWCRCAPTARPAGPRKATSGAPPGGPVQGIKLDRGFRRCCERMAEQALPRETLRPDPPPC